MNCVYLTLYVQVHNESSPDQSIIQSTVPHTPHVSHGVHLKVFTTVYAFKTNQLEPNQESLLLIFYCMQSKDLMSR